MKVSITLVLFITWFDFKVESLNVPKVSAPISFELCDEPLIVGTFFIMPLKNLSNKKFGKLFVLNLDRIQNRVSYYRCICDCGKESIVRGVCLTNGHTKSCGCMKIKITHGHTRNYKPSPEYMAWYGMKGRCTQPSQKCYYRYGGRGITVCDRWLNSFENFLADMGPKPSPQHSIDRIDNNGNYEPSNCRWATKLEQNKNKRVTVMLTYKGETKSIIEWAEITGLKRRVLYDRYVNRGLSPEQTIETRTKYQTEKP